MTIFGESGGGSKVSTLLAMPSADRLFHKAIVQSGPGLRDVTVDAASERTEAVLAELGIAPTDVGTLVDLPLDRLVAAQRALSPSPLARLFSGEPGGEFAPVVDGAALLQHPFDPVASPLAADVPLIIGTNKDESTTFLLMLPDFEGITREKVEELATSMHRDKTPAVLDLYARTTPDATPRELLVSLVMTDTMWVDSTRSRSARAPVARPRCSSTTSRTRPTPSTGS